VATLSSNRFVKVDLSAIAVAKHCLNHFRPIFTLEFLESSEMAVSVFEGLLICAKEVLNH
jgi:hypothetical protein